MRNWVVPTGFVIGVVALSAIALLREPAQFDSSTPEGTVQEYLQAISDEDYDRAFEVLHQESFDGCDGQDIARSAPSDFRSASLRSEGSGFNEVHFEPEFTGSREFIDPEVWVEVIIQRGDGGGLFGGGWDEWASIGLIDDDGFWWIVGDPWPHFVWSCAQFEGDF